MNDSEREEWVNNDEGLYDQLLAWQRRYPRASSASFVREHRAKIDEVVRNVRSGAQPAHYLKYGSRPT